MNTQIPTSSTIPKLERARNYIERNFAKGIRLRDAAKIARLSMYHFHRQFESFYSETPKQMMARLQIDLAKKLLGGRTSFAEIARRCGYVHHGHLGQRFKAATGMTPSEYRNNTRREDWLPRGQDILPAKEFSGLKLS